MTKRLALAFLTIIGITAIGGASNSATVGEPENGAPIGSPSSLQRVYSRSLVPLDAVVGAFGGMVQWEPGTDVATVLIEDTAVEITLHHSLVYVNGQAIDIGVPVHVMNERLMVPVEFIQTVFGFGAFRDVQERRLHLVPNPAGGVRAPVTVRNGEREVVLPEVGVIFAVDGNSQQGLAGQVREGEQPDNAERARDPVSIDETPLAQGFIWPPDVAKAVTDRWPGAELLPEGWVFLPDGRILDPVSVGLVLGCEPTGPCDLPVEAWDCLPGFPCDPEAGVDPLRPDSRPGNGTQGQP